MGYRSISFFWLFRGSLFAAWLLAISLTGAASGQQVCELVADAEEPGWQILSCRPDVSVSLGADATYSLSDSSGDGVIDTLDLDTGAVRTRVEPTGGPTHFQIRNAPGNRVGTRHRLGNRAVPKRARKCSWSRARFRSPTWRSTPA